jgi:DNA/RNA-binding domain of Phe-tRNA-synthetase-like protein
MAIKLRIVQPPTGMLQSTVELNLMGAFRASRVAHSDFEPLCKNETIPFGNYSLQDGKFRSAAQNPERSAQGNCVRSIDPVDLRGNNERPWRLLRRPTKILLLAKRIDRLQTMPGRLTRPSYLPQTNFQYLPRSLLVYRQPFLNPRGFSVQTTMAHAQHLQAFLDGAYVAPEIFQLRPDYRALLLAVDGITPGPSDDASEALLQQAEISVRAELAEQPVGEIPHVAAWQQAYKAFGAKPKKTRNSLEAMIRRVEGGLPRVNRLTDIYNAISIKYRIPLGGEDLNKYDGVARLIIATGKEDFETRANGETSMEHPDKGEVVWCDDAGVTCRRWNWRQGLRTALTDNTTSALFILDAMQPVSNDVLTAAADELSEAMKNLGPDVHILRRTIEVPKG